jgi:hypothetical protein
MPRGYAHGLDVWTFSQDIQHGHTAWNMQHGHTTWTISMDMQYERATWTRSKYIQFGHAELTRCMDGGLAVLTCSIGTQHGNAAEHQLGHAAWNCNKFMNDVHSA